jgi:hypothetical protein
LDSGAPDVSIPADVALTMVRTGTLQLGQSFLTRFSSWPIDNSRQELVLK